MMLMASRGQDGDDEQRIMLVMVSRGHDGDGEQGP